ncbi:MAG: mannose-1-phosphate guanylyltransferase, partial [Pseudomonadota bacterium]
VVNGDVWTDFDLADLAPPADEDLARLVLVDNPAHHPRGDFALEAGRVRDTGSEKLTFAGIGVYRPAFFEGRQPTRFPLGPLLFEAAAADRLGGVHHTGRWTDAGTPERLATLDGELRGAVPETAAATTPP